MSRCGWNPTLTSQETKGLCARVHGAPHRSAQAMPWGRCTVLVFLWLISSGLVFLILPGEVIWNFAVIGRDQVLLQTWGALTSASSEEWVKSKVPLFFVSGILLCVPQVIVCFPVLLSAIQQKPVSDLLCFFQITWISGRAHSAAQVLPSAKWRGLQSWGSPGFQHSLSSEFFV